MFMIGIHNNNINSANLAPKQPRNNYCRHRHTHTHTDNNLQTESIMNTTSDILCFFCYICRGLFLITNNANNRE